MKAKGIAVVLAAGQGKRMGGTIQKQYMDLCGKPVLYYTTVIPTLQEKGIFQRKFSSSMEKTVNY